MARTTQMPGFNSVGILNDVQHRKRLISLASQTEMPLNHRYSPYEPRGASTSRASLPLAAGQGGNDSPQQGYQNHQQTFRSNFFYDERAKSLDNGSHTVDSAPEPFRLTSPIPVQQSFHETVNIPISRQIVELPKDDVVTSLGSAAPVRSTSDHTMGVSGEAPLVLSAPNTPGKFSFRPWSRSLLNLQYHRVQIFGNECRRNAWGSRLYSGQ